MRIAKEHCSMRIEKDSYVFRKRRRMILHMDNSEMKSGWEEQRRGGYRVERVLQIQ